MAAEERRLGDWLSSWPHKDAHAVCAVRPPRGGLDTAVRVEFIGPPGWQVKHTLTQPS